MGCRGVGEVVCGKGVCGCLRVWGSGVAGVRGYVVWCGVAVEGI